MAKRRKFSDEFKREAVRLATQSSVTKSQISRELGINANLLGRWCRDYAANGAAAFPGQGKPRDEEMAALKRVPNTPAGVRRLSAGIEKHDVALIVVESTGGYERALTERLSEACLPVVLVNP